MGKARKARRQGEREQRRLRLELERAKHGKPIIDSKTPVRITTKDEPTLLRQAQRSEVEPTLLRTIDKVVHGHALPPRDQPTEKQFTSEDILDVIQTLPDPRDNPDNLRDVGQHADSALYDASSRILDITDQKLQKFASAEVLGEIPAKGVKKGEQIGTLTSDVAGTSLKKGDPVHAISDEEMMKISPAMVLAKRMMQSGTDIRGTEVSAASFTRATRPAHWKKSKPKPDETVLALSPEPLNKGSMLAGDRKHDAREAAVLGYLSALASCATDGLKMRVSANKPQLDYPDNMAQHSIIDAAVQEFAKAFAASPTGALTQKEQRDLHRTLRLYLGSIFYDRLKEARIFQFKERDFEQLYHLADVYTTTACGYRWTPPDHPERVPEKEAANVMNYIVREGITVPYPEKLPFHSCYFAWGAGVQPSEVLRWHYGLGDGFHLVKATLLTDDGWVFTILLQGTKDTVGVGYRRDGTIVGDMEQIVVLERIGQLKQREADHAHVDLGRKLDKKEDAIASHFEKEHFFEPGWTLPTSFAPWIVTNAVAAIEANDSLRIANPALLSERTKFKALSKRTKQQFLPRPYYTVIIQPTTYEEIEKRVQSQPRQWSHQWDVIGHWAHRIERGTLPLDPKYLHRLRKRGYEVYHAMNRPTSEVLAFLMRKRVMPPQHNEWIAYLKFRREAYVKGPKDKPYIPSIHKLKGGVPEVSK